MITLPHSEQVLSSDWCPVAEQHCEVQAAILTVTRMGYPAPALRKSRRPRAAESQSGVLAPVCGLYVPDGVSRGKSYILRAWIL